MAQAQDYAPPGYAQGAPDGSVLGNPDALAPNGQYADPSSRIATLTDAAGGISFAPAGSDEWAAIGLNRPVTTGDRLWVDPGGRAEVHAGTTTVRLGGGTAASILNLDDDTTQVKLTQGSLQLRVRALPQGQQVEVDTPNLAFVPNEPGDYRIDVSPDGSTTLVSMRHGSAVCMGIRARSSCRAASACALPAPTLPMPARARTRRQTASTNGPPPVTPARTSPSPRVMCRAR